MLRYLLVAILIIAIIAVNVRGELDADGEHEEQHAGGRCPEIPSMKWTYNNPEQWKDCPSWSACSGATVPQSPMNIVTNNKTGLELTSKIVEKYSENVAGNITNTGHSVQVTLYVTNNTLTGGPFGDKIYVLKQFHWHSPSEHTLDGIQPVLELHAVHINKDDDSDIVVISTMYQLTTNTSLVHEFLKIITATLPPEPANATQSTWEAHWASHGFNAAGEAFDDYFYMYRGSLTTPPCTPVTFVFHPYWSYTTQVELDFIRAQVFESNARPIQPSQGRVATKYSMNVISYSSSSTGVNGASSRYGGISSLPFIGMAIAALSGALSFF